MSGETVITVIGNLTADPELRFTPSGSAVANGTIASTPRTFDRDTNEWKDGETLFLRYSVWREAAENVAESLVKGQRVIAQGVLKPRSFETKEGEKRNVIELEVLEMGPSLKYAKATVTRTQNSGGNGGGFGGGQQAQGGYGQQAQGGFGGGQQGYAQQGQQAQGGYAQQPAAQPAAQEDPWATPGVSNPGGGQWGAGPAQGQQAPAQGAYAGGTMAPQQGGYAQQPQQGYAPQGQQQGNVGEPPF